MAMPEVEKLRKIKLVIFDVEGIFTDGLRWQDSSGQARPKFCVRDAMGVRALKKAGYLVAVVSSSDVPEIREQMSFLGIHDAVFGVRDKAFPVAELIARKGLKPDECALASLDPRDVQIMKNLGCSFTVPSAPEVVRSTAVFVTLKNGGDGAVLDVCNRVLINGAYSNSLVVARSGRRAVG